MSEEAPENYNNGDIVWVKLGSSWWPGEVKDIEELPNEILDFKKPPLLIVKFFDEDSYEYIKSWANVYPYNCEKKNEFIKKGMAAFRAKVPHMDKFPKDVLTAEVKIGGNPNILSEPMFLPEKKRNYVAEVFGTSPKTKGNKDKKVQRSNTNKSYSQKDTSHITHRRFLGMDDYRAYICIQYPGKDRIPGDREDDEVLRINREPEQEFNCHSCTFTTKRLEVMILHTKSHIQGVYVTPPRRNKQSAVRRKKDKSKKSRGSDVIESESSSSDSELMREKKRKPRSQSYKKSKIKKADKGKEEPKPVVDIRSELLAVWDDTDDEEFDLPLTKPTESDQTLTQSITDIILGEPDSDKPKESIEEMVSDIQNESINETLNQSADDTLNKSEALNETAETEKEVKEQSASEKLSEETLGQKADVSLNQLAEEALNQKTDEIHQQLPEETVVNQAEVNDEAPNQQETQKQQPELVGEQLNGSAGEQTDKSEVSKNLNQLGDGPGEVRGDSSVDESKEKILDQDEEVFGEDPEEKEIEKVKQKMDKDIQEAIKSCFDFDEDEEEDSTIVSKAAAGRKIPRVIPLAERRKSHETIIDDVNRDLILKESGSFNRKNEESGAVDTAFKELMEETTVPELPDVGNTLKCEQNFHNIKTIKFPDKLDPIGSPPKVAKADKKEPSEVATKLTNPKKRFVKSFEDFELMQNEIRRKEEQVDVAQNETSEANVEVAEANVDVPASNTFSSRVEDVDYLFEPEPSHQSVELSELKSKIMLKIIAEANIDEESKSKILSKMRDTNKFKVDESDTGTSLSRSTEESKTEKAGSSISHRTPRSKILELYRNDKNRQKIEDEQSIEVEVQKLEQTNTDINEEVVENRLREALTRTESVPPKKNKWSRRGSHPKKDRSLFLLEGVKTEDAPSKHLEKDTKNEDFVEVDPHIPLETPYSLNNVPSSSSSGSNNFTEEIMPSPTNDNTNVSKEDTVGDKIVEEEIQDVVPAEENAEPQKDFEIANQPDTVEETDKLSLEDIEINTPLQDEGDKPVTPDEEIDIMKLEDEKIDKAAPSEEPFTSFVNEDIENVSLPQTENDNLPSTEEVPTFTLNEKETDILPSNSEKQESLKPNSEEDEKESSKTATEPETEDLLIKDAPVPTDYNAANDDLLVDENRILSPNNIISPTDKCVISPEKVIDTENNTSNSEIIVEEQVITEEVHLPSPNNDVITPVDDTSIAFTKDTIFSPPKKSKKRKISDSYVLNLGESNTSKHISEVEQFSPVEKKKREADLEIDKSKEIAPVSDIDVGLNEVEFGNSSPRETEHKSIIPQSEANNTNLEQDVVVEKVEEVTSDSAEELAKITDHKNEVEIQCASSSPDSFKFSIQTNLSNLTSREEISALALATLSEIKTDLENSDSCLSEEKVEPEPEKNIPPAPVESELVPIEGNLTVVSEKDLADGQVEITTQQVISPKKPVTLLNFSMDFSDSASDSNSTGDTFSDIAKCTDFSARGTEFTSKAITRQVKKKDRKKENAYERLELLNILEGNSDTEKKPKEFPQPFKSVVEDICDFEEHIPSQIVCAKNLKREVAMGPAYHFLEKEQTDKKPEKSMASKLLERLTEPKDKLSTPKTNVQSDTRGLQTIGKPLLKRQSVTPNIRGNRYKSKPMGSSTKPIILSEQIVKSAPETAKSKPKKMLNDIEDVEAFIIHKDPKKIQLEQESLDALQLKSAAAKSAGKAKILQQTIITPAGEIIQPIVNQVQTDDNIFDINSMPIVLSDEILTPESIENMPIMISSETKSTDQEKTVKKSPPGRIITKTTVTVPQPITSKSATITKHSKPPRILQTVGGRVLKNSPLLPSTAKPGKYIIVPQSGLPTTTKYISKKGPIIKRSSAPAGTIPKMQTMVPEPSGNKIMIVTNQQGQQQRLLLTPAQQKMLGYQNQKATKTVVKGNVMQKSVLATKTVPLVEAGTSGIISKGPSIVGQKVVVNSTTGIITTTTSQVISTQGKNIRGVTKKLHPVSQKPFGTKTQKTILIKNQHGQTVRKIQGTDDELLDKQVAEQLEAIKASAGITFSSQSKQTEPYKATSKTTVRRSYAKKTAEFKSKIGPPPLSSLHVSPKPEIPATVASFPVAKKGDSTDHKPLTALTAAEEVKPQHERPLNQLVIQDAVGNQTTITEGQILALPSETVDGQPQSYMLVTLDESGNLTPLNSEALMSLDPNLGLGGDLSNMVLQIDQGALTERPQTIAVKTSVGNEPPKLVEMEPPVNVPVPEASITTEIAETVLEQKVVPMVETTQTIAPSTNGDPGQQLIVTGDPIATQKFLESLTEGTTDLANILANAEGNSILIQADGQQILINTNSDNQMLLSVNNDNINASESTEGGGNPIFATQPSKNQDILAAALADTDVFQQEQHAAQGKITSQLSPNNTLYPMNVGNVLETSLTLNSPIMTPLEVPSTNSKKIPDDEADILTQVPKNVDLPITITDPNIAQTVANQQVVSLIANELQTNLELALPISETPISSVSTEMNSPSYVYSLPTLDESVDISQKPFNSSMPLLNEDIDESANKTKDDIDHKMDEEETKHSIGSSPKPQGVINSGGSFLEEEEGRFTLGGEMCSSLSEPPPEMFDLPEENSNLVEKRTTNIPSSLQSTPDVSDNASKDDDITDLSTQAETSSEGSCEIPLQPPIVAKSLDLSQNLDSFKRSLEESEEEESKKCKFD